MPIEREPKVKVPRNYVPPNSTRYKVKDKDTWATIAAKNGIDPWDLIEANFNTRSAPEVNWYLHHYVGCVAQSADGKNWMFGSRAKPGIIWIPQKNVTQLYYVVPDMKLILQDKEGSCWLASAQMLISWRQRRMRQSEVAHPDPSWIEKWRKLYRDDTGLKNPEIAEFAHDLGLMMLGPVTPSPAQVRDLLLQHGPLWVNGKKHITAIAGIRTNASGDYQVLVFDPQEPSYPHGQWINFDEEYGLAEETDQMRLDAGPTSPTSMLCLAN